MGLKLQERILLQNHILKLIDKGDKGIAAIIAKKFGITRQAASRHINKLVDNKSIISEGSGRKTTYKLNTKEYVLKIEIYPGLNEDEVWRNKVMPLLPPLKKNVLGTCQYGFTEMLNNVIDHSESDLCQVHIRNDALKIAIWIFDSGIGIFNKIQKHFGLADPKYSILELAKGKLTTDPKNHTGEGIFFTSRFFDSFEIMSGKLFFSGHKNDDWLLESEKRSHKGTYVFMATNKLSNIDRKKVYDEYAPSENDYGFSRTVIPVRLLEYEGEELVSRSQAKRLIVRFERFKEVILDFKGIKIIGQAFADELFRVFKRQNPQIHLMWANVNKDIDGIIKHIIESV